MVFHCRCFSFSFEEDEEIEYESKTQTKSTSTHSHSHTFYTASSDLNRSISEFHAKNSGFSNLTKKPNNLRVFTVAELKSASNNFDHAWNIGEGGFGRVFRGVIKSLEHPFNEIQVAVKYTKEVMKGHIEWLTEVNVFGVVVHPNLVKLVGYCAEETEKGMQLFFVYEYMPNGSLRDHLSIRSKTPLSWSMRLKVAQDAACGLAYLHEEIDFQIIFRDFKSSNILLDEKCNAKISDFGMARLGPQEGLTHVSTAVVGTMDYAAPEYVRTGHLNSKSDVWSYGVFLYELITGRCPLDRNRPKNEQKLLEWVKPYLDSKKFRIIIDSRLEGKYSLKSAQKLSIIANRCLSRNSKARPKMSEVLEMVNQLSHGPPLKGLDSVVPIKPKKVFVGPIHDKKTNENTKKAKEGLNSNDIQCTEYSCVSL